MMSKYANNPEKYFGKEEKEKLQTYNKNLLSDLKELVDNDKLDDITKEEYYEYLIEYRHYVLAANALGKQYNSYGKRLTELQKLYKYEPDDAKAAQYLEEYNSILNKRDAIKKKYDSFMAKAEKMEPRVINIIDYIDTRLEELGRDMGVDERAKGPTPKDKKPKR